MGVLNPEDGQADGRFQAELDELGEGQGVAVTPAAPPERLGDMLDPLSLTALRGLAPHSKLPSALSADERDSFSPVPIRSTDLDELSKSLGFSPVERARMRREPKMGVIQGAARNIDSAIPFGEVINHGAVFMAMRRLREDDRQTDPDRLVRRPSGELVRVGSQPGASFNLRPHRPKEARDADLALVDRAVKQIQRDALVGYSFGGNVGNQAIALPGYMASFFLTGPVAGGLRSGVSQTVTAAVKKRLRDSLVTRGLARVAGGTTGLGVDAATRTTLLPQRSVASYFEDQVSSGLVLTDKGAQLLKTSERTPVSSFYKAVGGTFIEMFGEGAGAATGPLKRMIPKYQAFKETMERLFAKTKVAQKGLEIWTTAGWNGFVTEIGEEVLTNVLLAAAGVEDFGAEDPASILDRVTASFPNGEELLTMSAVLALPGATRVTTVGLANMIHSEKIAKGVPSQAKFRQLSDSELDALVFPEPAAPIGSEAEARRRVEIRDAAESAADTSPAPGGASSTSQGQQNRIEAQTSQGTATTGSPPPPVADSAEQRLLVESRIERLDEEQNRIGEQLDRLEAEKRGRAAAGRSTKAVDERMAALAKRFSAIDQEAESLLVGDAGVGGSRKLTTSPIRVLSVLNQKVRESARFTRSQIQKAQKDLAQLVRGRVPLEDRGRFLSLVRGIQSQEALAKALPEINARIAQVEEKRLQRRAFAAVSRILTQTRPKSAGGKVKSSLTPELQSGLDQARQVASMSPIEVDQELAANQAQITADGQITPDAALRNEILTNFGALKTKSSRDLRELASDLKAVVDRGRRVRRFEVLISNGDRLAKVAESRQSLADSRPLDPKAKPEVAALKRVRQFFRGFGKTITGWRSFMDMLSQFDTKTGAFESPLVGLTDVTAVEQKEKGDVQRFAIELNRIVQEVYGLTSDAESWRKIRGDQKPEDLGVFRDAAGNDFRLVLTRSEARKMFLEFQDPLLRAALTSENGGYQRGELAIRGVTPEIESAIFNEFLDQADRNFARAQLVLYRGLYDQINPRYRAKFGVDLPQNEFYSPISRFVDRPEAIDSFFAEQGVRQSLDPSFLKSRVKNTRRIQIQGDVSAMYNHVTNMVHWLNWDQKLSDIRAIFGDKANRAFVTGRFGSGAMSIVDDWIADFSTGGLQKARAHARIFTAFRTNLTTAALGLKAKQIVVQSISTFAAMDRVPPAQFVKHLVGFATAPVKNVRMLRKVSDLAATRGGRINRDINDARRTQEFAEFRTSPSLRQLAMLPTAIGDQTGLLLGGYTVFQHTLNKTGSQEAAVKAFDRFAQETQQSPDLSQLSSWQRGDPMSKMFTMFTSSQNQYLRREVDAVRNLLRGRGSLKDAGRAIAVYHFLLPMMYQWMADAFHIDLAHQLRAAVTGSFNGVFIIKDLVAAIAAIATNLSVDPEEEVSIFEGSHPVFDAINDIWQGIYEVLDAGDDMDATEVVARMAEFTGQVSEPLTGLPVTNLGNILEGFRRTSDGDLESGIPITLGWSPRSVDNVLERKERRQ